MQAHEVHVPNPEKALFPGITKTHLVGYYLKVAPRMLPHAGHRALSLVRHPEGVTEKGFFQKNPSDHFPDWLPTVALPRKSVPDETRTYTMVDDADALVYLAGQATIEFHGWLSRADAPQRPDRMVIDLDPHLADPERAWPGVRAAARDTLALLDAIGAPAFLLATGSRGLHVTVPLVPEAGFRACRALADRVARALVRDAPGRYTRSMSKARRGDRLFLDTLRNVYGATAILPWSLRARPHAPIAAPVARSFLDRGDARADRYTFHDVMSLMGRADPWAGFEDHRVPLDRLRSKADEAGL